MSRKKFLLKLRKHKIDQELIDLQAKERKAADDDLHWMLEKFRGVWVGSLQQAESFCYTLLDRSGVDFRISSYDSEIMKPEQPQKFGEGPIYIVWHIEPVNHILFITIWKE